MDKLGCAHVCAASENGGRTELVAPFKPFLWAGAADFSHEKSVEVCRLEGPENLAFGNLLIFESAAYYEDFLKSRPRELFIEKISSLENQYLMQTQSRFFAGMGFSDLRRMQLDIETSSTEGFPDPTRPGDRVIAVGIGFGAESKIFEIENFDDESERELLLTVAEYIIDSDPDTIEGHNIFRFDLDFIRKRCKRLKIPMRWGRFNADCEFRNSRIKIAERMFEYTRCDIPGRSVVDTLLMLQLYDISARELSSYSLKSAAVHFGFSKPETRTYIDGGKIQEFFQADRETFRKYLLDDIRETHELADRLLPAYIAQVQNFPLTLQEGILRGTGVKVEYVFLEKYLHARAKLPAIPEMQNFVSGGLSESFRSGVFKNVLHYDVASLYPSLMLNIGKCPKNDYLNIFLDVLRRLREDRLEYKRLAREASDPMERNEMNARQNSFKILINSFYGYLGLATARFGDTALADEITTMGRDLLKCLIADFEKNGCEVLEADTDGIYISCGNYFDTPQLLLEKVDGCMPQGVDLEFDGAYTAMFCYKAKNYALLETDGKVILKGSALRSRATEKYLSDLTRDFINIELGASDKNISKLIAELREKIAGGKMDISSLVKSEHISVSPERYKKNVEDTGKGRRASLEAALKLEAKAKTGDKVRYFISNAEFKKGADWKRAYPIEMYDAQKLPYDADYYEKKLDEWMERFAEFLPAQTPKQGELF